MGSGTAAGEGCAVLSFCAGIDVGAVVDSDDDDVFHSQPMMSARLCLVVNEFDDVDALVKHSTRRNTCQKFTYGQVEADPCSCCVSTSLSSISCLSRLNSCTFTDISWFPIAVTKSA